ncbi:MAG: UDP-glucose--hexose-1-phosphate uridylyltransferase, partial [Caldibacillus sp.]
MTIYAFIQLLLNEGMKRGMIEPMDEIYVRNRLLALLQLDEFKDTENLENYQNQLPDDPEIVIPYIIDQIVQYACERGIIEDYFDIREIFSAKIMDCFLPHPSTVNRIFFEKLKRSPREATDYFYAISKNSNYIQMSRIKKNIVYQVDTEYGELDITINLSKPEKDPKQIALEKSLKKKAGYPKCALCIENEGYAGRIGFAARSNHRMIRIPLRGETWYLQYSPYSYYNEHCIVLSEEHRNMEISRETYQRLLDFVELFPHYFLGSNADLPIVGGSILTHDHYQGGRYEFAMARAADEY